MKHWFVFLLSFLSACFVQAQDISVVKFQKLENDLDARVNAPVLDQNGQKCALLKVVTIEKGFTFDVGQLGVVKTLYKPAEVWVYVPKGVNKIKITHPQLGQIKSDDGYYWFPEGGLTDATCYRITITTKSLAEIETASSVPVTLLVKNNVSAEIWLEGKKLGIGTWSGTLKSGKYIVECRKEHCYPSETEIQVYGSEALLNQKYGLTPPKPIVMGLLFVMTTPSDGVRIWIDGEGKGLNPKTTFSLPVGSHHVKLEYDGYEPKEFVVNIEREETVYLTASFSSLW